MAAAAAEPHRSLFCSRSQILRELRDSPRPFVLRFALILSGVGLGVRLCLLIISGNLVIGPLSGASDQVHYQTLADNLFEGRGFTYAGQPTALRPPLYPMFLAGMRFLFGSHRFLIARCFQFLAALVMAYLCLLLARRLFGIEAGVLAVSFALAMPTLAFGVTELQSEALASFFTLLFLCFLIAALDGSSLALPGVGFAAGSAVLLRFNSALLLVVAIVVCLWYAQSAKRTLIVCASAGLLVAPWVIYTERAFHGKILFSSQTGVNLLQGVLMPEGRTQVKDGQRIRGAVGWSHQDIETNGPSRLRLPGEDQLDRQARTAALDAWKKLDWPARFRLVAGKLICFLLSTDQLLDTASFSAKQRLLRGAGVVCYWCVLGLAVLGWSKLYKLEKAAALSLGFYVILVTVAHLPFVMNTRLRIPFFDALFAVLAGGGFFFLCCSGRSPAMPEPE